MACEIRVPDVYDNHRILSTALEPFSGCAASCTVFEPADSPDWFSFFDNLGGRRSGLRCRSLSGCCLPINARR